jgi:hypothetical protein
MKYEAAPEFATYAQVPFYRRRWFYGLSALVFMPITVLILLTGEVYLLHEGAVKKFLTRKNRIMLAAALTFVMAANLLRIILA